MARIEKYLLADGKPAWMVRYDTFPKGQRKQHKKKGFKTEREAKTWASRVEVQINDHQYIEKSAISLNQWMGDYIDIYCTGLAPKTKESYSVITAKIKKNPLGDKPLQTITTEEVQQFINDLLASGNTENTALHYLRFLSLVFKRAVTDRKIRYNPCVDVIKPKIKKYKHHILTTQELSKLLHEAKGTPMYIPVILGGCMGLRKGEALGLTWQDVDFNNNTLTVNNNRQRVDKQDIIRQPKTDSGQRVLYMPQFVAEALREHQKEIVVDESHNLVCSVSTGEPISTSTFTQRFKRLLKRASMDDKIRFHDLRHTSASILTVAGASPKQVSDYLGHSNIAITMDLYAGIFEEAQKATAKKLNKMFKNF